MRSCLKLAALVWALAHAVGVLVPGVDLVLTAAMVIVIALGVRALPEQWRRGPRLGSALLKIYRILRVTVKSSDHLMRPYFDAMKEAYLKGRKKPAKGKAEPEPEPPKD